MMHVLYAMEENALKRFMSVKQDLYEAQKAMSAADIAAAKAEILQAAKINDIVPDKDISLHYSIDENGRANIPVVGMLTNSVDPCAAFFGESITTYDFIKQTALSADENPNVKEIAFHFDTNGGHVAGVDVTSQVIYNLKKPTIGINHGAALSAGQWLISQTKHIVDSTPTAFSGSIGVAVELISRKKDDEARGIERITLTSTDAPDKRVDFTTKSGQEKIIKELDDLHEVFVQRVSEGRSRATGTIISKEKINKEFGNGGVLISKNAIAVGMVDEILGNTKDQIKVLNNNINASSDFEDDGVEEESIEEPANPNPNEHACRLISPDQFIKFRRKNDAGKVNGKRIDHIIGIRANGGSDIQAIRYPKDIWKAEDAKKHCKDRNGISFDPASGAGEPESSCKDCGQKNSTHKNEQSPAAHAGENQKRLKMNLDEFLNQNPEARAEYDKRIAASAEKVENRIKAVSPFLGSKEYAKAMPMAVKALTGEVDLSAFKGAIAAFDMLREQNTEVAAQEDSEKTGETPASQPKEPSKNGEVSKPEDIAPVVASMKNFLKAGV